MSKRGNRVVVVRLARAELPEVRSFRSTTCVYLHVFYIATAGRLVHSASPGKSIHDSDAHAHAPSIALCPYSSTTTSRVDMCHEAIHA